MRLENSWVVLDLKFDDMEEWKEYHISDICKDIIVGGDAAKYNTSKIRNFRHNIPVYANSTENEGLYGFCDVAIVKSPAVTVAARGAGSGFVAFRNEPFVPIVRLISLITNQFADTRFLYYYLKIKGFSADGSAIPQITVPMVKKQKVFLPSIGIQRKISSVLSSLDSKMETNRKINENLEQQAQALFKSWFIDFEPFKDGEFVESEMGMIPKGWKVEKLGNITVECKEKVGVRDEIKVLSPITSGELVLSEDFFNKQVYSKSIAKYILVEKGDFAYNPARVNIGSLGLNEFDFNGCVSPVYVVFRPTLCYTCFIDYFRKTRRFKDIVKSLAIGGVRQTLKYSDFANIAIVLPPINVAEQFAEIVQTYKSLVEINNKEINKLASLRNTLLPKLMSGKIKV